MVKERNKTEARQGRTLGVQRYVLGISIALAAIVLLIIWWVYAT